MSKHKAEIEKTLNKINRDYQSLLEQNRVEWLQQVIKQGRDLYGFKSLGELIAFIVNHIQELQKSPDKSGVRRGRRARLSRIPGQSEESYFQNLGAEVKS